MVVWQVFTSGDDGTLAKDMPANVETQSAVARELASLSQ